MLSAIHFSERTGPHAIQILKFPAFGGPKATVSYYFIVVIRPLGHPTVILIPNEHIWDEVVHIPPAASAESS